MAVHADWAEYDDGSPTYTVEGTIVHSGSQSQKIATDGTGSYYGISQVLASNPSVGSYTTGAYVKTDTASTDFYLEVTSATDGTQTSGAFSIDAGGNWVLIQFTFQVTTSEAYTVRLYTTDDNVTIYVDDFWMLGNDIAAASTDSKASAPWPKYPNPIYIG